MNPSNPTQVRQLIKNQAVNVKKRFGQNFLVDDNILKKIVAEGQIDKQTTVIEIGPGLGGLTQHLLDQAKTVIAYEIDNDLIPFLKKAFQRDNFHLIHDDFLKRTIDEDIQTYATNTTDVVVIANLPYYITTPILMKCLEESTKIRRMVVMMQLEVAKRITAIKNTKDYNALSVAVQYRARTTFAFKVPKQVFIPEPNVESAVITLDFTNEHRAKVLNEPYFFMFLKACFKQRRKTILNNIEAFLNIDKETISTRLIALNISPQSRAESLSMETIIEMANLFNPASESSD